MIQDDIPKPVPKSHFLGKWDFIICAILGFLATAGNRDLAVHGGISQIPAEWVEFWIGSSIGVLAIWALVKGLFLLAKRLITRPKRIKTANLEALRQRLRHITLYDEAKIDRLIEFERDELKRKNRPQEPVDSLMTRAIERWNVITPPPLHFIKRDSWG